jgi:hypothetical protein
VAEGGGGKVAGGRGGRRSGVGGRNWIGGEEENRGRKAALGVGVELGTSLDLCVWFKPFPFSFGAGRARARFH